MVAVAILVGLVLGSFLSVLLARWPKWQGVFAGRSSCPHCGNHLAWYDLVPLVSWLMLGGKCRNCHAPISPLYPILEITMATVFALWAIQGLALVIGGMLFVFVALFFFDIRHFVLPDALIVLLAVLGLARFGADSLVIGAALIAVFGALYVLSHGRWLGLGDVKLGGAIGLALGFPMAISATILAIWAGALVGILLMILGRAKGTTALPFGAFWSAAAVLALIAPQSLQWLSRLLTLQP